jgi:probable HAF family extracellular repeat protein
MYTTLDDPNAVGYTNAFGINAGGQIVGAYADANNIYHGFLLWHGQYTTLDDPNAGTGPYQGTFAAGTNASGEIVGYYFDASSAIHGFLLSHGQYATLEDPNAGTRPYQGTRVLGINARGDMVGAYQGAFPGVHGFLLSAGQYTTLDDPKATDSSTAANGINDRGQIVGQYGDAGGEHGFLLSGGQYSTLDDPNGIGESLANGINAGGHIVGLYFDANFKTHGFLATKAQDDDTLAGTSLPASRSSGNRAHQLLPPAALTDAALTDNQVINVAAGFGANRSESLSGISTGQTRAIATPPSSLDGSGHSDGSHVHVVSTAAAAAGKETALTGNDDVSRVDLFSWPDGIA